MPGFEDRLKAMHAKQEEADQLREQKETERQHAEALQAEHEARQGELAAERERVATEIAQAEVEAQAAEQAVAQANAFAVEQGEKLDPEARAEIDAIKAEAAQATARLSELSGRLAQIDAELSGLGAAPTTETVEPKEQTPPGEGEESMAGVGVEAPIEMPVAPKEKPVDPIIGRTARRALVEWGDKTPNAEQAADLLKNVQVALDNEQVVLDTEGVIGLMRSGPENRIATTAIMVESCNERLGPAFERAQKSGEQSAQKGDHPEDQPLHEALEAAHVALIFVIEADDITRVMEDGIRSEHHAEFREARTGMQQLREQSRKEAAPVAREIYEGVAKNLLSAFKKLEGVHAMDAMDSHWAVNFALNGTARGLHESGGDPKLLKGVMGEFKRLVTQAQSDKRRRPRSADLERTKKMLDDLKTLTQA